MMSVTHRDSTNLLINREDASQRRIAEYRRGKSGAATCSPANTDSHTLVE